MRAFYSPRPIAVRPVPDPDTLSSVSSPVVKVKSLYTLRGALSTLVLPPLPPPPSPSPDELIAPRLVSGVHTTFCATHALPIYSITDPVVSSRVILATLITMRYTLHPIALVAALLSFDVAVAQCEPLSLPASRRACRVNASFHPQTRPHTTLPTSLRPPSRISMVRRAYRPPSAPLTLSDRHQQVRYWQ